MAKVFVGNFSFSVDDVKLKEFFSVIGNVTSAKVMTEGFGGRSRGFGFVEFSSSQDAERAISQLDGSVWEGRVIKVSEDRSGRRGEEGYANENTGGGGYEDRDRGQPMGYFRAQPLDIGVRKRKKSDPFLEDETLNLDYKDGRLLARYMSERGRILPRRMTGLTSAHQRAITRAIKRAQHLALLPNARG